MPGFFYALIGLALGLAMLTADLALRSDPPAAGRPAAAAMARRPAAIRGRCLGMVAHELQTSGFALLALPGPAAAAAQRLLALADDVNDSLAAEAAPLAPRPGTVPLAPLLEEAVATVTAAARNRASGNGGFRRTSRRWRWRPTAAPCMARWSRCSAVPPG